MTGARHDYTVAVDPEAVNNPHSAAIRMVGTGNRVLEVGCSAGHVTRHLVARGNTVVGVEPDAEAAKLAEAFAERVHVADIDRTPLSQLERGPFDVIVLGDVLEHLRDPGLALDDAATLLTPGGRFVISVPNVAHIDVRMMLLGGGWTYKDDGLLDRTHLRWFTQQSLRDLLAEAGFVATAVERVCTPFGSSNLDFDRAAVPRALIDYVTADPEANTLQYVVEARREGTDVLAASAVVEWPPVGVDDSAARHRIVELERERDALEAEVTAWRNSKLVRAASPLRRAYALARRLLGRGVR
jgi:2-polyprenyl-3-methyl-5-hydroxy-6-metoxy-1,4-benzoquinol methylase